MKSISRLLKRAFLTLTVSAIILLIFNVALLVVIGTRFATQNGAWHVAEMVADQLQGGDGTYELSATAAQTLEREQIWSVLLDNDSLEVVWASDNLPPEIPRTFSLPEVVAISHGYLQDYPIFSSPHPDGIIWVGTPPNSFWRLRFNSWPLAFIQNLPFMVLAVLLGNALVVFVLYALVSGRLLRSISPILQGLKELPKGEVSLEIKGPLAEVASSIIEASDVLKEKDQLLRERDAARANWIAGVSHDIRTPLSLVIGYASQLEPNDLAVLIGKQGAKIKALISDLNLASKLEYAMQPLNRSKFQLVPLMRQLVVDLLEEEQENRYPLTWEFPEEDIWLDGDPVLIRRAVVNLIQNAKSHNPEGCGLWVAVEKETIKVSDDGVGVSDAQLRKLSELPASLVWDLGIDQERHGLGLLIVKQIMAAHGGWVEFGHFQPRGLSVVLHFPTETGTI